MKYGIKYDEVFITGVLDNLLPDSGASDEYCQGIMVGLMAALISHKFANDFPHALRYLANLAKPNARLSGIPNLPGWREDWDSYRNPAFILGVSQR